MVNPERGDVELVVNGEARVMRLTLGALAALEARLEAGSLAALIEAFEAGNAGSGQILALIWAGLNGGGWAVSYDDVAAARIGGGPLAAVAAAGRLLRLTFAGQAGEAGS